MSNPILLANDRYYAELTQQYNPGDTTIYLTTPPDNVPTLIVCAKGTANETVFLVLNKTLNSVTNVSRVKGANIELLIQTPVTCLNNADFINQYRSYLGISWRGEWADTTDYILQDGVIYNGSSYICIQAGTNHLPTDTDYWQLTTSKGEQGVSIVDADVVGDDIVFTLDDSSTITLVDAMLTLKGDPGSVTPISLTESTLIEDTTNTDTYAGVTIPAITSYFVGLKINLKVTNANTGASTLNVCGLGAKSIKKNVTEDTEIDDIKTGQILPLVYDGTNFQIVGGGGNGGSGDFLVTQVFS